MGPTGTYGFRWQFPFIADNGTEYLINIRQRNYSGNAATRNLGRAPILKRESAGAICGTSLEIYAECLVDGEFSALYTSDARKFFVELLIDPGRSSQKVIWQGFVTPELYSEPDIAPPYDVQIIATDGLGELKSYQYAAGGRRSLMAHMKACLDNSGLIMDYLDLFVVNDLHPSTGSVDASVMLRLVQTDLDFMVGESCYDVLTGILKTINAKLTMWESRWVVVRENDLSYSRGYQSCYNAMGGNEQIEFLRFGSMVDYDHWPIGNLTQEIVPARKRIATEIKYYQPLSMFPDGDCEDSDSWTVIGNVSWQSFGRASWRRPYCAVGSGNGIGASINVTAFGGATTLKIGLCSYVLGTVPSGAKCTARIQVRCGSYYLARNADGSCYWTSEAGVIDYTFDRISVEQSVGLSLSNFTELELPIRYIPATGSFGIEIRNYSDSTVSTGPAMFIGWVYLLQDAPYGYRDNVAIGNGAREDAGDIELLMGDAPYSPNALTNVRNILSKSDGTLLNTWQTTRLSTARNFIELMAVDHALTSAAERWKITGKLNMPEASETPLLLYSDGRLYFAEEFSWDLLNSECDVSMYQRPTAASLTVESSEITEMTESTAGSSSGHGGGGGGTGGATTYAALPDKPLINTVELSGSMTSADLGLIGYDVLERVEDGEEVTAVFHYTVKVPSIYFSGSDISNISNDGNILQLTAENGIRFIDDANGREIDYGAGILASLDGDDLGAVDTKWGAVWADNVCFGRETIGGTAYTLGFAYQENAHGFNLTGNIYFRGNEFLPAGQFAGSGDLPLLGNLDNWWGYTFSRNFVVYRGTDNINRSMSWGPIGQSDFGFIFNAGADFSGDVYAANIQQSSDRRLKKNIKDMDADEARDILSELRPVDFEWRSNGDHGHGFIAQEVEDVIADLVKEKSDGKLTLNYSGIIAYLVKGWQEHEARISELEEQIAKLITK